MCVLVRVNHALAPITCFTWPRASAIAARPRQVSREPSKKPHHVMCVRDRVRPACHLGPAPSPKLRQPRTCFPQPKHVHRGCGCKARATGGPKLWAFPNQTGYDPVESQAQALLALSSGGPSVREPRAGSSEERKKDDCGRHRNRGGAHTSALPLGLTCLGLGHSDFSRDDWDGWVSDTGVDPSPLCPRSGWLAEQQLPTPNLPHATEQSPSVDLLTSEARGLPIETGPRTLD